MADQVRLAAKIRIVGDAYAHIGRGRDQMPTQKRWASMSPWQRENALRECLRLAREGVD